MNRNELLAVLPPYTHTVATIKNSQTVNDIVREVLDAHEVFAPDYDTIAAFFEGGSNVTVARHLFDFLKENVRYKIESEGKQTTKSPAAILAQQHGDCKHYAGFTAGVLDALNRQGRHLNFHYRFASYNLFDKTPGHVFVVLNDAGREYWIDPVLKSFDERLEPTFILNKKPTPMLQRVSGVTDLVPQDFAVLDAEDRELSPELLNAIALLLKYKVMDAEGRVNDSVIDSLSLSLTPEQFEAVANARIIVQSAAAIGGFFSDVWRGVKKVTLAVPRNAYLSLVALNVFGYGTKLARAIYSDNSYTKYSQPAQDQVYKKWWSLGGDWQNLENAIKSGAKKPQILAGTSVGAAAAAVPVWVAAASAIIAALTPLLKDILASKGGGGISEMNLYPYGVCADGFTPKNADGSCPPGLPTPTGGGRGIMDYVQRNPMIVAGGAVVVYLLSKQK